MMTTALVSRYKAHVPQGVVSILCSNVSGTVQSWYLFCKSVSAAKPKYSETVCLPTLSDHRLMAFHPSPLGLRLLLPWMFRDEAETF